MSDAGYIAPATENLQAHVAQVKGVDSMAEAGRKILLTEFIRMLKNEAGSHLGEDPEYVHRMRVATRRMRSAFRILEPYFKSKSIAPFTQHLRKLARALGDVRDLDVLIGDLQTAKAGLDDDIQAGIQILIDRLERKRRRARKKLITHLDSGAYRQFKETFAKFLTHPGKGVQSLENNGVSVVPIQVRHILPIILHEHLANVRAYDTVLSVDVSPADSESEDDDKIETVNNGEGQRVDPPVLHDLRIEFKRLRYAISFFQDVLGASGEKFVSEIKIIQDHLGRLNDLEVAQTQLHDLLDTSGIDESLLNSTLAKMAEEQTNLENSFPAVWVRFNKRTVQSQLSNALLVLR